MVTFFTNIVKGMNEVINFFKGFFEMIKISIELIPQPFRGITLSFLPILIASIIYKVVKK